MAAGIVSYGAYVPPTRLAFATIGGRPAKEGGPEKAVAWNDEDAVTMAVSAAVNCLRGFDRASVDGLMFASTSYPFQEKQGAALLARVLDLGRDVRTADFSGSLRAGTGALRAAVDAVVAGSSRRVLVVVSDCRLAAPNSPLEANFGDGAVAFLVSGQDAIATLDASFAVADEIVDVWRTAGDPFVHSWEDRFVVQEGFTPRIVESVRGLLEQAGAQASEFAKVALYAPDKRSHGTVVRKLRLDPAQVQDPLFGRLGNAGAAFSLLQLAHTLESAKAGDRILIASYGDGAEALALTATELVDKLEPRRGVSWHLERRRGVKGYDRYLKARGLTTTEYEAPRDQGLSATIHFRERDEDLSLVAQKCRSCGAVQFPHQRVCETCFTKDQFDRHRLSDKVGRVLTYTFDFFFPTPDPPVVVTICEVDGARVHLQAVNLTPEEVTLDMPVELEFRRIHQAGGRPNYYWKATPAPEAG
ncbi:MAG: zinc ribbon domain-containing protein [Myxococcota bacterium]|nr:zinc ribbon domain-containing protein [Myxococcota bacterium]